LDDIKIITIIYTDAGALWAGYPEAKLFDWIRMWLNLTNLCAGHIVGVKIENERGYLTTI